MMAALTIIIDTAVRLPVRTRVLLWLSLNVLLVTTVVAVPSSS